MLKDNNQYDESERNALLDKIATYRFAALETALYLDTHPNDPRVLARHNEFCTVLKEACEEYATDFNDPLSVYETADNRWTYIDRWPVGLDCMGCMKGD